MTTHDDISDSDSDRHSQSESHRSGLGGPHATAASDPSAQGDAPDLGLLDVELGS